MFHNAVQNMMNLMYEIGRVLNITSPARTVILVLDICIVLGIICYIFKAVNQTRARQIFKGVLIIFILSIIAEIFDMVILGFLLNNFLTYAVFILIVVFQPELRKILEQLGRSKITDVFENDNDILEKNAITEIVKATEIMSMKNIGALIVIEQNSKIKDILKEGISLNANVSAELIQNIFTPKAPLHDGAIVVDKSTILAAKCILPLASEVAVPKNLGTRHRAAVGISEISDAFVIVVSEETGTISLAENGKLTQNLTADSLKEILIKKLEKGTNIAKNKRVDHN